jgi:hypothetical protein
MAFKAKYRGRYSLGGVTFLALLSCASFAAAQSPESVDVVVTAEVPARCGFTTAATTRDATGDLENAGRETIRLGLDCNAPYAITARAVNGRMVRSGTGPDGSDFAFEKSYGVTLTLDTDSGLVTGERCVSEDLVQASTACALSSPSGLGSGDGISIERDASLVIDWPDQRDVGRRLAEGSYSDTIILEIGARA